LDIDRIKPITVLSQWYWGESSIDAVRERVAALPFVVANLMTLEYDSIYEI